jgi:hypothetical protein
MSQLYYLTSTDEALSADQIKSATGVRVETTGIVGLNNFGIYPVTEVPNPYDARLYDVTLSYTVNGTNADETWTETGKDLAVAKVAGKDAQKDKYEAEASSIQDDYGTLILTAIAAKTSAQRSANEISIIDSLKTIATNLSNDIIAIDSAADVDAINAIVNP